MWKQTNKEKPRVAVCDYGPSAVEDHRQGDPQSLEWSTPPPGSLRNLVSSSEDSKMLSQKKWTNNNKKHYKKKLHTNDPDCKTEIFFLSVESEEVKWEEWFSTCKVCGLNNFPKIVCSNSSSGACKCVQIIGSLQK